MSKILHYASFFTFYLVNSRHVSHDCFEESKLVGYVNEATNFRVEISDADIIQDLNIFTEDLKTTHIRVCTNRDTGYLENLRLGLSNVGGEVAWLGEIGFVKESHVVDCETRRTDLNVVALNVGRSHSLHPKVQRRQKLEAP